MLSIYCRQDILFEYFDKKLAVQQVNQKLINLIFESLSIHNLSVSNS